MNRINQLFASRPEKLLSLYFCAGAPTLEGTAEVLHAMQQHGIAMVEVGIPFSDPMADGPVIQNAATKALRNGMTLRKLFSQLEGIRRSPSEGGVGDNLPLILMGYLNPIMQFITPETSEERIRFIDDNTSGFIYMVSSAAITGAQKEFNEAKQAYFNKVHAMHLKNPTMIGFGISNRQTLESAQANANGAIIGSKFVQLLDEENGNAPKALDRLFEALKE